MPSRHSDGSYSWAQAGLGWAALSISLLSALWLGANRPFAWTLLGQSILVVFVLQVLLVFVRPTAKAMALAVPILVGYCVVLAWGWMQVAVPVSLELAHPVWSLAPGDLEVGYIGADPGQGRHILLRLATYGMIAWIVASSALNSGRAWRYVQVIAVFSSLLATYGLYAALTGVNPILGIESDRPTVVSASFVNRNSYATYAAFGLLANVAVYLHVADRGVVGEGRAALRNFLENFFGGAWIYALGALLCGAAVALSASRGGGASAIIGVTVFALSLSPRRGQHNPALWGVLAVIIGFVIVTLSSNTVARILSAEGEDMRFTVFPVIFQHVFDRPFLGQGIGAFEDTFRGHVPLEAAVGEWRMAHNSYLENFYELGIPAATLLYLVLATFFLRFLRGLRIRREDRGLPALALACFATGSVHSMFDFSLQMPACAALFAAILGIGWAQSFARADRKVEIAKSGRNRKTDKPGASTRGADRPIH